ncbi:hypothetical protein AAL_07960 [Moelleriella libera RCEF 2490]|uniref:Uncharacterized protein n=1 Tax=Moelleriella libera RCEF 2490 TaxID=1081109 RepID=A0A167WEZ3_9HYPO|nr:hypothetical protein AAL_07960 [Moelleriella libera RCEF 2490]
MEAQLVRLHDDAFSLWLSITCIDNPEVLALSVNSHDEAAASGFLSSLQHVRSSLERWASGGGLAAGFVDAGSRELPGPGPSSDATMSTAPPTTRSTRRQARRQRSSSVLPDASPLTDDELAGTEQALPVMVPRQQRPGHKRRQRKVSPGDGDGDGDECNDDDAQRASCVRQLSAQPASCLVPAFLATDPPKPNILRLASAMRSPRAVGQVCQIRQFLRNGPSAELNAALIDRKLTGQVSREALDRGITICKRANHFANLLQRVSTWHFSEVLEQSKSPVALRVSSDVVSQFMVDGTKSRYNRTKFRGDLLHMVCGWHRGLVAFIPLFKDPACGINDPEAQYQYQANKKDFETFKAIYGVSNSVTNVLCAIGTSFLDSCCYQDRLEFQYGDWLSRLQQDFSPACIQAMADQLGGKCGCR